MEWIAEVGETWLRTLTWVVSLGTVFGLLAWLMPCNRRMFWWTNLRSTATDVCYWFVMPIAARVLRVYVLSVGITILFGDNPGFDAIRAMPLWLQCVVVFLMQDVMLYWIHRGFHTQVAWGFHAIHHSPKTLDWLAAGRFHLVNSLFSFVLVDMIALTMGFSNQAINTIIPIGVVYSCMVHANLNWTFGPLRYVFASPVYHRWHHVAEGEGMNKNFAPTFPFLDLLWGTYYMPMDQRPENFGNGESDFPEGFVGQFFYPFQNKKAPAPPTKKTSPKRRAA